VSHIAYCTGHLHGLPLAAVADMARQAGYAGLDINGDGFEKSPQPHVTPGLDARQRQQAKSDLRDIDMEASALGANVYLVPDDEAQGRQNLAYAMASVDLAAELGIPFVHCFTGRQAQTLSRAEALRRLSDALAELCRHGAERGVQVGIEGCVPHFIRSTADYLELIGNLPGVDLRVCFDPSHVFLHGESEFTAAERLFDRISIVHVKDAAGRFPDFSCPPLGKGRMDWPGLLSLLRDLRYEGQLAVEYEADQFGWKQDRMAVMLDARRFLRDHGF